MITKPILELIYESAHIQRWNDHIRPPQGFTELDKQAHKMFYAYVIAKFEETSGGCPVDWKVLIEGALFEFFHRTVLTDIIGYWGQISLVDKIASNCDGRSCCISE